MGCGSPLGTGPYANEPDQRRDKTGGVFQRLALILHAQDGEPQEKNSAQYRHMNLRLAREVGAGKRDLIEVVQAQLGESQTEQRKDREVTRGRPPRPSPEAKHRGNSPDGGCGEQEERAPGAL